MALFDDDNQFAGFEEEDEDTVSALDTQGEEGEAPPPPSNRGFIIGISILGGIILLGILAVILISVFGNNNNNAAQIEEAARIDMANTATVRAATEIAASEEAVRATEREARNMTLSAPTATQSPTPVISFPTETLQPTPTRPQQTLNATQVELTRQAEEKGGGDATPTATLSAGAAQTATAMAAGGMPGTGFADEVGLPLLVGMAALLLVVIFVARRLRTA